MTAEDAQSKLEEVQKDIRVLGQLTNSPIAPSVIIALKKKENRLIKIHSDLNGKQTPQLSHEATTPLEENSPPKKKPIKPIILVIVIIVICMCISLLFSFISSINGSETKSSATEIPVTSTTLYSDELIKSVTSTKENTITPTKTFASTPTPVIQAIL